MKLIILSFIAPYFFTLLMLPEMNSAQQNVQCNKNEIKQSSSKFFPIILKNKENNDFVFKENPQFLEQIISLDEELLQDEDQILVFSKIQEYRLIQIYQREKLYLLQMKELKLDIFDSMLYNVKMELIYSFNFNIENCDTIIHVYYLIQQKFIIVCEQIENYQIKILKINESTIQIHQSFEFQKQSECQFDVFFNENNFEFLVIFLNCLDWQTYMIEFQEKDTPDFKDFVNREKYIQESILRKVTFDDGYYFQFDHQIIQFFKGGYYYTYQNYQSRILDFENKSYRQIVILQSNYEQKSSIQRIDINQIVITKNIKPKQILIFFDSIVLLKESQLECIVREDETFIFQVQLESIQTISFYPFFIGKRNNQFIFFKKNEYSFLYNCNDYLNQTHIQFASSNLFKETEYLSLELIFNDLLTYRQDLPFINMSINEEDFQFIITPKESYDSLKTQDIQFLENDVIYCEELKYEIVQDCLKESKLEILWQINAYQNSEVIKVLQLKQNQSIIVIQCNSNKNMNFGYFEKIKEENIFLFQNDVFLLSTQKRKVLKITLRKPIYNKNIFEFKDEVMNIVQHNTGYEIVLKSCVNYLITSGQKIIEQQNYKVNSNGQCIQEKLFYSDFLEIDFPNQVFIFKSQLFTNTISYQNQTIHDLHQYHIYKNTFLVLSTMGNRILAISYQYVNFQFIPLRQILNESLNYAHPLKHSLNDLFLVIAAFDQQNNSVLFIYSLTLLYNRNLFDIIRVDNFTFTMASYDEIFFYQQQQLKKSNILETFVKCRINQFTEFIKTIKVPLLLIDKLDQTRSQLSYIQFNLINRFQKLKSISTEVLLFKYHSFQQFILFDPRIFVFGPIETISSNTYELIFPLVQIDYINRARCEKVNNAICINENNQSLTISNIYGSSLCYKVFDLQQMFNFMTFNSGLYFIVCYLQESTYFIEVYLKTNLESIANLTLIQDQNNSILNIQIFNQYCLINFQNLISLYEIQNNTFNLISSYNCYFCKEKQIINSNFVGIFNNITQNKTIKFIIYDFFNQEYFQVKVHVNEFINNHQGIELYFQILFMELKDNNQYYAQVLIFLSQSFLQVSELSFNKENMTILRNAMIRVSPITTNQAIFFMQNNQILILSYYDTQKISSAISIYNISELNLIDEIYTLYTDFSLVQKYNESHFIVEPNNQSQDYIVYQVDSYKIKFDNEKVKSFNLTCKNSLSQLEFQIHLKNDNEENIFLVQLSIIIACEIILLGFLFKRRRSKYLN